MYFLLLMHKTWKLSMPAVGEIQPFRKLDGVSPKVMWANGSGGRCEGNWTFGHLFPTQKYVQISGEQFRTLHGPCISIFSLVRFTRGETSTSVVKRLHLCTAHGLVRTPAAVHVSAKVVWENSGNLYSPGQCIFQHSWQFDLVKGSLWAFPSNLG